MVDVLSFLGDDVLEAIKGAGVPGDKVGELSDALGSQLGGSDGLDLGDLLGGLDLESFLEKIDVEAIATQIGVSPSIVAAAVDRIGPKVAEFAPGALGSLASKLFD